MEKAVVRRGIGAVVLALVAALLLGYLLKGKAPERKEVVNLELPKSPIQIFPGSGENAQADGQAGNAQGADGSTQANNAQGAGGDAQAGTAGAGNDQQAGKLSAIGAATGVAAGAVANGTKKAGGAVAGAGKGLAATGQSVQGSLGKDQAVDAKTGNAALAKSKVVVDGAGQAVYGAKTTGVTDSPAKINFQTTANKKVRPSVDGKATLNKKSKVASKKKPANKTAKKSTKSPSRRSNARLVGEKKLPPVSRRVASNKSKKSSSKKVASTRSKKTSKKKASRNVIAKKKVVAKKKTVTKKTVTKKTTVAGRNKYVVQLLATSSAAKANSLKATMKREGYPAYVSKSKRGGKSLYRVRVGSYSGKSSALKKQAKMKRRYRKNSYIQSSIVVRN